MSTNAGVMLYELSKSSFSENHLQLPRRVIMLDAGCTHSDLVHIANDACVNGTTSACLCRV